MKQSKTRTFQSEPLRRDIVPAEDISSGDRRQDFRHSANQYVAVTFRNTTRICDLVDLCETGAKLTILDGAVPNVDEQLTVTLFDGTTVGGRVTWVGERHIGIAFIDPVTNVDDRLDFEDLGSAYFGRAVSLQKSARRT